MLLIGPGRGHNILPIIEELNHQELFKVDFFCHNLEFSQVFYSNINFIPYSSNFIFELKKHLKLLFFGKKYDILFIQGGMHHILLTLIYILLIKSKKKIFCCWSNQIIDIATTKSRAQIIAKLIFKKSDFVFLNWHSIKERFENNFPQWRHKAVLSLGGLHDSFFLPVTNITESNFVKKFLEEIPDQNIISFWPRSIIRANRHDLVIEAIAILKKMFPEILENFTLYLWGGNVEDKHYRLIIEKAILDNDLIKNIKIVDHPFVSFTDIRIIEKRSDFFIQISEHDILSTFIIEVMLQEKDVILSNIRPYQCLNEFYNFNILLVDNDPKIISEEIKNKILNINNQNKELLATRKKICEENFKFSKNYPKLIEWMFSL